jgi:phosphoglycerate dehydrogenase-like enzyme
VIRPTVLLWLDAAAVYRDAAERAGLADSVELVTLSGGEAVRARAIAGAVLDVFRTEPLPPDHPFWTTPGITVLPHLGGFHPARDAQVARLFVDNLARFLAGERLAEVVDRERGY